MEHKGVVELVMQMYSEYYKPTDIAKAVELMSTQYANNKNIKILTACVICKAVRKMRITH